LLDFRIAILEEIGSGLRLARRIARTLAERFLPAKNSRRKINLVRDAQDAEYYVTKLPGKSKATR
jgi:hypothetical protein